MNIIHFSTIDKKGAGEAAYRLHKNLYNNGHQSLMIVLRKSSNDDSVVVVGNKVVDFFYRALLQVENMNILLQKKWSQCY